TPHEYLSDVGFEEGTMGGWYSSIPGGPPVYHTLDNVFGPPPLAHSGVRSLEAYDFTPDPVYGDYSFNAVNGETEIVDFEGDPFLVFVGDPLRPEDDSVRLTGWVFYDAAVGDLGSYLTVMVFLTDETGSSSGGTTYNSVYLSDMVVFGEDTEW